MVHLFMGARGLYIHLPYRNRTLARITRESVRVWRGSQFKELFEEFAKRVNRHYLEVDRLFLPDNSSGADRYSAADIMESGEAVTPPTSNAFYSVRFDATSSMGNWLDT